MNDEWSRRKQRKLKWLTYSRFSLVLLGGVLTLPGCSGGDSPSAPVDPGPTQKCPAAIVVSQSLDVATTWAPGVAGCAHFLVTGDVIVWKQLTIQPGTTVSFGPGAKLLVNGALSAVGTSSAPIKFVGQEAVRGYWNGLHISSNSTANELNYVEVRNGGGVGGANAANITVEPFGRLLLANSTLKESAGSGLYAGHAALLPSFSNNKFQNNAGSGIRVPDDLVGSLDTGSDYTTGNGKNFLDVYSDDVSTDQTWRITSAPIRVTGTAIIWQSLSIASGVTVLFGSNAGWTVEGSLTAIGTSTAPVKFFGEQAVRGFWRGITISSNANSNELTYVDVAHAGSVGGTNAADVILDPFARLKMSHSILRESAGSGLYAGHAATLPEFSANALRNNAGSGIRLPDDLVGSLDVSSDYTTGNGKSFIDVFADDISGSQTWRVTSAPIRFTGSTIIWGALAISPGVNITMAQGAKWTVEGSLTAIGIPSSMIRLRGEQAVPGFWEGLVVSSNSNSNELAYVEIANGGGVGGTSAANVVVDAFNRLRLTNSIIRDSAGWGLFVAANGTVAPTPLSSAGNTFSNNVRGGANIP